MTDDLFTALEKKEITSGPRAFEVINKMDYKAVIDLAFECFVSIKDVGPLPDNKLFTFAPIPSIAGGPSPCGNLPCRLETAYSLSLVSALYADKIVLPNFFDYMFHFLNGDGHSPETEEEFNDFAYRLASDIAVCYQYKPLLDEGLAVMNFTTLTVCADCHKRHQKESADFQKELAKVIRKIKPLFDKKVSFIYQENDYIEIRNDDNYLGGEKGWAIKNDLQIEMRKHTSEIPYVLTNTEVNKFGLRHAIVDESINDILEYDFYPALNTATYLTNRQLDIDLIEGTKRRSISVTSTDTLPGYHKITYLQDILLEDAIALRRNNEECFRVYRNAVAEMVKKKDPTEASAFFNTTVNPAIDRINNLIAQNKKHYRAAAGRKIKTRTIVAIAGVGAANLLGIPLEVAASAASATGVFTGSDIVDDFQTSAKTPLEAKTDSFYFMWEIQQSHAR